MWQCQSLLQADKSFELKKLALRGYYGMEYKLFGTHTMRDVKQRVMKTYARVLPSSKTTFISQLRLIQQVRSN